MTTLGTGALGTGTLGNPTPGAAVGLPVLAFDVAFTAGPKTFDAPYSNLPLIREFSTERGRSNGVGRMEAGALDFQADNRNRYLDAYNTASPYHARMVTLPGGANSDITHSNTGATHFSTDLVVAARLSSSWAWSATNIQTIAGRRGATSGWDLSIIFGSLRFRWYTGGVASIVDSDLLLPLGFEPNSTWWVAVTLDSDTGGGQHAVRFWYSPDTTPHFDEVTWDQLGPVETFSGTTTIDSPGAVATSIGQLSSADRFVGNVWSLMVGQGTIDNVTTKGHKVEFVEGLSTQTAFTDRGTIGGTWTRGSATTFAADTEQGSWVRSLRKVRVTVTYQSATYTLFEGFIEEWPNIWPVIADDGKGDAVADVSAVDALKPLAQAKAVSYSQAFRSTDPEAYWRFDELQAEWSANRLAQSTRDADGAYSYGGFVDVINGHVLESLVYSLSFYNGSNAEERFNPYTFERKSLVPSDTNPALGTEGGVGYSGIVHPMVAGDPVQRQVIVGDNGSGTIERARSAGIYPVDTPALNITQPWLPQNQEAFDFCGWVQLDMSVVEDDQTYFPLVAVGTMPAGLAPTSGPTYATAASGGDVFVDTLTNAVRGEYHIFIYVRKDDGLLRFIVRNNNNVSQISLVSTTRVGTPGARGQTHFFVCTRDDAGVGRIYVDGKCEAEGRVAAPGDMRNSFLSVCEVPPSDYKDYVFSGFSDRPDLLQELEGGRERGIYVTSAFGTIDEVGMHKNQCLSESEVRMLWEVGNRDFTSDATPRERIVTLLDSYDWPQEQRVIDTGEADISAHNFSDSILKAMQGVAVAEDGDIYFEPGQGIVFADRKRMRDAIVRNIQGADVIFGDQGTEIRYVDLKLTNDDDDVINDVAIDLGNSIEGRAQDRSSIKEFGNRDFSRDAPLAKRSDAKNLAEEIVRRNSKPRQRIKQLRFMPGDRQSGAPLWHVAFGLNLLDKVVVRRTPPGGGARIDVECFVIGIEHAADAAHVNNWVTTLSLVEADLYQNTWKLGTSTIGQSNILGY